MSRQADSIALDACTSISAAAKEIEQHAAVYELAPEAFTLHALAELAKPSTTPTLPSGS